MSNNPYVEDSAKQAKAWFQTLRQQQQESFGGSEEAMRTVTSMWAPVIATGAVPYGFSPQLDQLLQANVMDTGAQGISNAVNALELQQRQLSGGAAGMPSGADAALRAQVLATGQQSIARGLQEEKIAGYAQGLKNLEGATEAELGVGKTQAELGSTAASAGAETQKTEEAAGAEMFKENQATSGFAIAKNIEGLVGGAAGIAGGIGSMAAGGAALTGGGGSNWLAGGSDMLKSVLT
jgi:hypothetical protein